MTNAGGKPVRDSPTGFPLYVTRRQPRVVTADVWAFLSQLARDALPKGEAVRVAAFVDQAFEFFEAARNPRTSSRPLLYYYSFLNLAKVLLVLKKVKIPLAPRHGVRDPRENTKSRLQLAGQTVFIEPRDAHRKELFPEFVEALGGDASEGRKVRIVTLLRQIPGIHRTFCRVTREPPSFMPVKEFVLLSRTGRVFGRLVLERDDSDVRVTGKRILKRRRFRKALHPVHADEGRELWFETAEVPGATKARDKAIREVARALQGVGVWSILTRQGYRFYFSAMPPRDIMPPLASIYAVMFYLGSITRYKPYDFDRIVSQRFSWLVSEFLRTQPGQFVYCLASHAAGVDVVPPFASLDWV
jgi:hypothetical protein